MISSCERIIAPGRGRRFREKIITKLFFASVRSIFHALAYQKKFCISSIEILRWSFRRARLKLRPEAMMLRC